MTTGRKPTPTRLKLIKGNPGKRAINKAEPKIPLSKQIRAPSFLSPDAKTEYKRVANMLSPLGVLSDADLKALELYAETYSTWREATVKVHEVGMIIKAQNGFPIQNPYLGIANQSSKRMQSLLSEFGMTPSSRSRITSEKAERNEFDDV